MKILTGIGTLATIVNPLTQSVRVQAPIKKRTEIKYQALQNVSMTHNYKLDSIINTRIDGYDMWDHWGDFDASFLPIALHMKISKPATGNWWFDDDAEGSWGAWKMKLTFKNELGEKDSIYLLHDDGKDYDGKDEDYSFLGLLPLDLNHISNGKPTLFGTEIDFSFFKGATYWSLHTGTHTIMTSHDYDSGSDNEWSDNIFKGVNVEGGNPFARNGATLHEWGAHFVLSINQKLNSSKNPNRVFNNFKDQTEVFYEKANHAQTILNNKDFLVRIVGKKDNRDFIDINWKKYNMHWGALMPGNTTSVDIVKESERLIEKIKLSAKKEIINNKDIIMPIVDKLNMNFTTLDDVEFKSSWGVENSDYGHYTSSTKMNSNELKALATISLAHEKHEILTDSHFVLRGFNTFVAPKINNSPISSSSVRIENTINVGAEEIKMTIDHIVDLPSGSDKGESVWVALLQTATIVGTGAAMWFSGGALVNIAAPFGIGGVAVGVVTETMSGTLLSTALPAFASLPFTLTLANPSWLQRNELAKDIKSRININKDITNGLSIDQAYRLYGSAKATSLFGDKSSETIGAARLLLDVGYYGTKITFGDISQ